MDFLSTQQSPQLFYSSRSHCLTASGVWTLATIESLEQQFTQLSDSGFITLIDASHITHLDTAGAWLLCSISGQLRRHDDDVPIPIEGLNEKQQALVQLVQQQQPSQSELKILETQPKQNFFYQLGRLGTEKALRGLSFLNFIGETLLAALHGLWQRMNDFKWADVAAVIDHVGCGSLPIVGLLSFLIGIVLAYQLAVQLQLYGAEIYVVEATGIGILREFSPLITAIILAGKTSTAFAALLGTMKINEEIDALKTMGVSPIRRLVLPRLLALIIVMPLLTVWASLLGILGSMLMSKALIDIDYTLFMQRFAQMVALKQYVLGMIKTPIFAMVIASVGCFQGLNVGTSADSVGKNTTQAAVQAIFLIIVIDAAFSILYSWYGL